MKKIKLYIATSLDGKIAKADGDVNWLHEFPNPDQTDHGYTAFLETIDTTLMGNTTYQQILGFDVDFPYTKQKNYVFTRNAGLTEDENVSFVSGDIVSFVKELKTQAGKDIWLIGGGQINTLLANEKLIDEMLIFIMPIILGEGIPLFEDEKVLTSPLTLVSTENYSTGAVGLTYRFLK